MASPSTSASFPAVGDTFTSLKAFKQAAYSAAIKGSYELRVWVATVGICADLHCIGGGSHEQVKKGRPGCSCHVSARLDPGTKIYSVRKSVEGHNCRRADPDSAQGEAARKDMKARMEALDASTAGVARALKEEKSGRRRSVSDVENEPAPSTTKPGRFSFQPQRYGVNRPTGKKPRDAEPDAYGRAQQDLEMAEGKVPRRHHPLTLPAIGQPFTESLPLLVHLYAWAEQQRLRLNHYFSGPDRFAAYCLPPSQTSRCPFGVVACRGEDGQWRTTSTVLKHDKRRHSAPRTHYENDSDVEDDVSATSSASSSSSLPSSFSSAATFAALQSLPSSHRSAVAPTYAGKLVPPAGSSSSLPPVQLSAFLTSLSSSTPFDILILQAFLRLSGVSTVTDLVALAELEERTVVELVEAVKAREEWTDKQAFRVVEGLSVLRAAFERA